MLFLMKVLEPYVWNWDQSFGSKRGLKGKGYMERKEQQASDENYYQKMWENIKHV